MPLFSSLKARLNVHLEEKQFNHEQWLNYFLTNPVDNLDSARFPYRYSDKKCGEVANEIFTCLEGDMPAIEPLEERSFYLVTMPFLILQADSVNHLVQQLQKLGNEAFGTNRQLSTEEASKRLAVIVGANRSASLDQAINREALNAIQQRQYAQTYSTSILFFHWNPVWTCTDLAKTSILYPVKTAYQLLKALRPTAARVVINTIENKQKPFDNLSAQVPYQQIRETIKNHRLTQQLVSYVWRRAQQTHLYLSILDSDFLKLSTNGLGLFSHYDRLIDQAPFYPSVMTTGYAASETSSAGMQLAVRIDMAIRKATAEIIKRGPYYPEPNILFLLKRRYSLKDYSFMGDGTRLESRRLISNAIASGIFRKQYFIFEDCAPVKTDVRRLETAKINSFVTLTNKKVAQKGFLEAIHGIKQSHAFPREWAGNLYVALPIQCPVTNCTPSLMTLYSYFDPIAFIISFPASLSEKYSSYYFDVVMRNYLSAHRLFKNALGQPQVELERSSSAFAALFFNRASNQIYFQNAQTYFLTKCKAAKEAIQTLAKLKLTEEWQQLVIEAAANSGRAVHTVLNDYVD